MRASKNEKQQAQEDDQIHRTVHSRVKNGEQPHRSVLQSQSRDKGIWSNDSLKVVKDILCRSSEASNRGQSHLQVVPSTTRPKVLQSIHSSSTAARLGVTKTLQKLRTRFYWADEKDVRVCLKLSCLSATQQPRIKKQPRQLASQFSFCPYWY